MISSILILIALLLVFIPQKHKEGVVEYSGEYAVIALSILAIAIRYCWGI